MVLMECTTEKSLEDKIIREFGIYTRKIGMRIEKKMKEKVKHRPCFF